MTYDEVGNLTDDGESFEYEYDAFGRLRKVKDRSDDSLVAEYKYNGLGHRISVHEDTDDDGDVDSNDKWFHSAYNERWQELAVFREDDSDPKEEFFHHGAGLDGMRVVSLLDGLVLRDKDANTSWTSASDGTLEERIHYCQNWRGDVVALVEFIGEDEVELKEWVKYSAYGVPFGCPGGDTDSDGDCDQTDVDQVQTWINASAYDVRGDIDLNGGVDSTDKSTIDGGFNGTTLGWANLSAVGGKKGLGGYERDMHLSLMHVRARVLVLDLGRWLQRDPLVYVDSPNVYLYAKNRPTVETDPSGMGTEIRCGTWSAAGQSTTVWGDDFDPNHEPPPTRPMGLDFGQTSTGHGIGDVDLVVVCCSTGPCMSVNVQGFSHCETYCDEQGRPVVNCHVNNPVLLVVVPVYRWLISAPGAQELSDENAAGLPGPAVEASSLVCGLFCGSVLIL